MYNKHAQNYTKYAQNDVFTNGSSQVYWMFKKKSTLKTREGLPNKKQKILGFVKFSKL